MLANNAYVLGLTGGICCGKSEAAKHLESLGAYHIDADAISRALTAPGGEALGAIREAFGDGVFSADGTLNRPAMAKAVFSDPAKKRLLEGILHPMVQRDMLVMLDRASEAGAKVAVLNVPLLIETGLDALCDETWCLTCGRETQISRMATRDRLGREQAEARIAAQMPLEEKEKRCGRVISSEKPVDKMLQELTALYQALVRRL